mgnify:CR=1 FL=1
MMSIGEKVKYLRKSQNMSQETLANYLKINRNYLSRIETDKSEPTASIIKNISNLFGISINSLLETEVTSSIYEEKVKYVTENCKLLIESDLDFLVRIISIMKEEYVKKNKN